MQNFMNSERYCRCRKLNESLRLIQRFLNVTFESQDTEFGPQTVHLRVLFTRRRFKLPFVQIFILSFSFPHPWFWYILGLFKLHHISLVFPYCIIIPPFPSNLLLYDEKKSNKIILSKKNSSVSGLLPHEPRIACVIYPYLSRRQYCSQAVYSYMHAPSLSKVHINIATMLQRSFMIMMMICRAV